LTFSTKTLAYLTPESWPPNTGICSRDLIVLNATSHVLGAGHGAVLIGNPKTGYKYFAKNGTTGYFGEYGKSNDHPVKGKQYDSRKEFEDSSENKQDGPYNRQYELKTDETTDKKMEAAALAAVESDYYVMDQSCIDVASDALTAG